MHVSPNRRLGNQITNQQEWSAANEKKFAIWAKYYVHSALV